MPSPLLRTKLYIPPHRPNLVSRPRLIEQLEGGLQLGHRLTLVSAPAGFGKTTLISEWIDKIERPAAWFSLGEEDNDLVQFLSYVVASLQQIDQNIGKTVIPLLQTAQPSKPQSLVTALINDIIASASDLILVLDDYHLISSETVHQALEFLLDNQPPLMHTIISTRGDPPLSLPRMRARGQVTEIRERNLRFTFEESVTFLAQTMGLKISPEAVAALEERTEGWITGLQLAGLALQKGTEDTEVFVADFSGDDRYVMDYLLDEVLKRESEEVREFLRQTAILDRLTAPLCNALTGRKDGQSILEQLEGANLFLIPLDNRREWYRYHRLFAEVLQSTLDDKEINGLHQRAALWYDENDLTNQAIQHTLTYARTSGDLEDAERLIGLAATKAVHQGGLMTVFGWLNALPDERIRANPVLATSKGWALVVAGEMGLATEYVLSAETAIEGSPMSDEQTAHLLLLRSFISLLAYQDYTQAVELATGALDLLPTDQPYWRVIALWALAEAQERTGHVADAIIAFGEAQQVGQALGEQPFTVTVDMALSAALNNHGKRRKAVVACEAAIARYTDEQGHTAPLAGMIYSQLGRLFYEAHRLDLALQHHDQALSFSQHLAMAGYLVPAHGFRAQTLYVLGDIDAALETIQIALKSSEQTGLTDSSWLLAREANIHLQQGDLPFVLRWVGKMGLSPEDTPHYLRLDSYIVYSRVLLAQDRVEDAQRYLEKLAQFLQERGLYRWLLSVSIQQALVEDKLGEEQAAQDYLTHALDIAVPEDYYRAFLDENTRVIDMLPGLRHHAPTFIDQLLGYARGAAPEKRGLSPALVEPLSERERDILALVAEGFTNQEVALKFSLSLSTIKWHLYNAYGKLGVRSRTQAVARSRQLGLIPS